MKILAPRRGATSLGIRLARLAMVFAAASAGSLSASAATSLQVSAAFDTTCAVISGAAWCWGYNANGQLGDNTTTQSTVPVQVTGLTKGVTSISTSGSHSCAVVSGGAWCWGKNADGQLGDNTNVQKLVPVQVTGLGGSVTAIATGDEHSCALVDGGVMCWGANIGYGQLGNGTATASGVPVSVTGLASGVSAISAGRYHTCALASGVAYCWGRGDSGELGDGTTPTAGRTRVAVTGSSATSVVSAGGSFTCGVDTAAAYCWGFGGQGQLGNNSVTGSPTAVQVTGLASGVTRIAAGSSYHGCAIVGGGLQCWGYNNAGQLGNPAAGGGSNVPVAVSGLGSGVTGVSAGGLHTCAIATAGLYCWGENVNGQLGRGNITPSNVPVLVVATPAVATALSTAPAALDFGGQSMNTTSPPASITITNTGAATITISTVTVSAHFSVASGCTSLAPAASCAATVTFTPTASGALTGALVANTDAGLFTVDLAGIGERSLVTHYYRSILRRAPDAGGKAFWGNEAGRVSGLGANVNETWYSLAQTFYFSGEYSAFNRTNNGFVTDLYNTFFNRAPDSGGLAFWVGNLDQGMPREVALADFMLSAEFRNFTQAIFGNTAVRAEIDAVMDFYRGLLLRLPDNGGFNFWVGRFRTAQCQGQAAVTSEVEAISSAFATSGEYVARGRSNAQYVGDLYNAFLRRGGDLGGVQYWINQIGGGFRTREQVRVEFKNSPEFQGRVNAIIAQGCL